MQGTHYEGRLGRMLRAPNPWVSARDRPMHYTSATASHTQADASFQTVCTKQRTVLVSLLCVQHLGEKPQKVCMCVNAHPSVFPDTRAQRAAPDPPENVHTQGPGEVDAERGRALRSPEGGPLCLVRVPGAGRWGRRARKQCAHELKTSL